MEKGWDISKTEQGNLPCQILYSERSSSSLRMKLKGGERKLEARSCYHFIARIKVQLDKMFVPVKLNSPTHAELNLSQPLHK